LKEIEALEEIAELKAKSFKKQAKMQEKYANKLDDPVFSD